MTDTPEKDALARGREVTDIYAPQMEAVLKERYDALLPGMSESLVEWAYGRQYARPGLSMRDRMIATIAGLAVLGGQTGPQLKINVKMALKAGLNREEIAETIWQMAVYGGMPAAINALNVAIEAFAEIDAAEAPAQ